MFIHIGNTLVHFFGADVLKSPLVKYVANLKLVIRRVSPEGNLCFWFWLVMWVRLLCLVLFASSLHCLYLWLLMGRSCGSAGIHHWNLTLVLLSIFWWLSLILRSILRFQIHLYYQYFFQISGGTAEAQQCCGACTTLFYMNMSFLPLSNSHFIPFHSVDSSVTDRTRPHGMCI